MKKNEQLFYLIKSLSKSEKRYFKIFCFSSNNVNNYLRLFEELDKQTVYDESSIRQKFAGETFIKQLHVTKNYLKQLILSALRNYHQKFSKEIEIRSILDNIEVLYNKELVDLCKTEIEKGKRLANEYGYHSYQLALNVWQRKILLLKKNVNTPELKPLLQEANEIVYQQGMKNRLWEGFTEVFNYINDEEKKFPKKFPIAEKRADFNGQLMQNNLSYIYSVINQQGNTALMHLENNLNLLQKKPHKIKENPESYLSVLNNKLSFLIRQENNKEVEKIAEQIRLDIIKYGLKTNQFTVRMVLRSFNLELERSESVV